MKDWTVLKKFTKKDFKALKKSLGLEGIAIILYFSEIWTLELIM